MHYLSLILFLSSFLSIIQCISINFTKESTIKSSSSNIRFLNEISFPTTILESTSLIIKASLGNPAQPIKFKLSINTPYTWVASSEGNRRKGYNPSLSSSYQPFENASRVTIPFYNMQGYPFKDTFSSKQSELSLQEFPFILVNERITGIDSKDFEGVIGICSRFSNYKEREFSLVEALYQEGKIQIKIFYIEHINHSQGRLVIGEYPKNFKNERDHYHHHEIIKFRKDNYDYFNVNVHAVFFSSKNNYKKNHSFTIINTPFQFNAESNTNMVSQEIYQEIKHNLFDEAIKNGECYEAKEIAFNYIYCNADFNKDIGTINFVFDDWTYQIGPDDYFFKTPAKKFFLFISLIKQDMNIFGNPFMKKFLTIFNIGESKMWIYDNNN